jgi:thiamine pyrophosphokinase
VETVLVFGGGDTPLPRIVDELPRADLVVAADGGYDTAIELGYRVDVLVGDFDSIVETDYPDHVILERHPEDKDATDLELALELISREDPSRVVVVGAAGGRLDHELAVAGLLCADRFSAVEEIDWISDRGSAHVVRGRRIIHGDVGALVTLTAMHGDATGVTTRGLKWELNNATLVAGSTRGVSNVMVGPVADIEVEAGCLLVILSG